MTDLDIPFVLERTAEIVKSCLEFDELCVFLEGRKGFVPCTCWSGHGPCGKDDLHPVEASIQGALRLGRPFFTRTTIQLREGSLDDRTPVHVVACPMVASSRTIGILYCARFGHAASFGGEDVQFLSLVASFAASAISHQWNLSHAQRSTAKLEAILGSLREGVIVCDHEFRILSANQAARRMLGRRHVIGVELSEILSGFAHSFDPKAVIATRTFDIERPSDGKLDGEGTSYRATLSRLSTLDDLGPQFIICVRDVSIERYNELLQLRVVHRLAHKLRTPLTLLGSASSILGERPLESNPETQDLLRVLRENVEKLSDIVDRFLDCTGTEEHRPGLSLAQIAVPLDYVLAQSIGLAADEIRKSGLRIDDRLGPLRDLELVVNPERLCRSFHQIIQNACKFAGSGSTLVIEAWLDDALRVRFTDDGPGV
ncbi:MAG TPA: histidine kinase dimerization/phospho-acceptor domain-containing protein, partial [Planctomycetota bacterium]|nr:histidine kinase dimerization/phospho-acceptor domain-containing protein [Planctomycetota bacterium]